MSEEDVYKQIKEALLLIDEQPGIKPPKPSEDNSFGVDKWRERTRAIGLSTLVSIRLDGWSSDLKMTITYMPLEKFGKAQNEPVTAETFTLEGRDQLIKLRDFLNELSLEKLFKMQLTITSMFNTGEGNSAAEFFKNNKD